jgi:hypothetical protein
MCKLHSFVVNADLWKEEFLEFDYIGAPWPNKIQMNPNLIGSLGLPAHSCFKYERKLRR